LSQKRRRQDSHRLPVERGHEPRTQPFGCGVRSLAVVRRHSPALTVRAGISALMLCAACSTAPAPEIARASVGTPPPTAFTVAPGRDRVQRPLPEPDARSRFAPPLNVEITVSRDGFVEARTAPGATCTASLAFPSAQSAGPAVVLPLRVANQTGAVAWTYEALPTPGGSGLHTVRCTRGGQEFAATAAVATP